MGLRWLVSLYNNNLNGILADEMARCSCLLHVWSLVLLLVKRWRVCCDVLGVQCACVLGCVAQCVPIVAVWCSLGLLGKTVARVHECTYQHTAIACRASARQSRRAPDADALLLPLMAAHCSCMHPTVLEAPHLSSTFAQPVSQSHSL